MNVPRRGGWAPALLPLLSLPLLLRCGGGGGASGGTTPIPPMGVLTGYPAGIVKGCFGMPLPPVPFMGKGYTSFTVAPALPEGLRLDPARGTISGTPLATAGLGSYRITAAGPSGTAAASLSLGVDGVPVFAQEEVFRNETGLKASVPALPGFTCQWTVRAVEASAVAEGPTDQNMLTYATGPTLGTYEISVRIQDGAGHACTSQRTLRTVGNRFLKDVRTPFQRAGATATPLLDGSLLVAGGSGNEGQAIASAEIYDPVTGTWAMSGDMSAARLYHTATRLLDGRVLVTGGHSPAREAMAAAEIYSPATRTWTPVASLPSPREQHTATLLPDGDVLVVGGQGPPVYNLDTAYAEVFRFHADSSTWTPAASLKGARKAHTATLLTDGRVLVAGGWRSFSTLLDAEIYDPAADTWTPVPNLMAHPRDGHCALLLPDGKVMVVGSSYTAAGAEIFDPATGAWAKAGTLAIPDRRRPCAALLPDGHVLVAGGETDSFTTPEWYDPAAGTWSKAGSPIPSSRSDAMLVSTGGKALLAGGASSYGYILASPCLFDAATATWKAQGAENADRFLHTATSLADGRVLVAGGFEAFGHGGSLASALLYDDKAAQPWSLTPSMTGPRQGHGAALLPSGQVLVAAGKGNGYDLSTADLFDPATGTWRAAPPIPGFAGATPALGALADGRLMMTGGLEMYYPIADVYLYDAGPGAWTRGGSLAGPRYGHTLNLMGDGKLLVVGGTTEVAIEGAGGGVLGSTERFDPAAGTWSPGPGLIVARAWHTATRLGDGRLLVAGGSNRGTFFDAVEWYDPRQDTWVPGANLATPRTWHSATLLPDGTVLVVGGLNASGVLGSAERYDPAADRWTPAGSLGAPRDSHTATLLPSGKVLIVGGDLGYVPEFWKP